MPVDVLVPLTVVVGDEDLLVGRAVGAVLRAARELDPQVDVRDLAAGEVQPGDLPELLSPSLFGDRRVLVVRAAQDLDKSVAAELMAYVAEPLDEVAVVACHAGGAKGKALLAALLAAGARRVDAPRMTKVSARRDFLRTELRSTGRRVTEGAVTALLDAVGSDLRELCSAAGQLLADTSGPVDEEVVGRYHRGRADLTGFTVADRAVEGDLAGALELVRYGQATGLAPVLVTSALAGALRSIALVASAGHAPAAEVAAALGMPPWKVDKTRKQVRGWRPEGLSAALVAVAEADAAVKGAAVDQDYAVERALLAVTTARAGG
ncbi:MAG TPA: DNA polymerase III subunit delta [Mycobacteriales bacterium]|nr:DNA polymerase III subunit delta [Mycobacteriales bacterium]